MLDVKNIIPLIGFLAVREDDQGLNHYLSKFGTKPKLKRVEHTASLSYKKNGFSLDFIEEEWTVSEGETFLKDALRLRAFFLYSNGYDGFGEYRGPLFGRVHFCDHRTSVKAKLGEPFLVGGGNRTGSIIWPLWDQYHYGNFVMRIQYQDEKVSVIIFLTAREVERLTTGKERGRSGVDPVI